MIGPIQFDLEPGALESLEPPHKNAAAMRHKIASAHNWCCSSGGCGGYGPLPRSIRSKNVGSAYFGLYTANLLCVREVSASMSSDVELRCWRTSASNLAAG